MVTHNAPREVERCTADKLRMCDCNTSQASNRGAPGGNGTEHAIGGDCCNAAANFFAIGPKHTLCTKLWPFFACCRKAWKQNGFKS